MTQTDMIQIHRVLERMTRQRTALINQIRGFLNEYGVVVSKGKEKLLAAMPIERRGKHKAVVAVANKMARIMWSMLYHRTEFRAN